MKLRDKTAIVAGGGQGIGEGIALCLAEEGADVAVVDLKPEGAARVADKVKGMGRRALPIAADLRVESRVVSAVGEAAAFLGRIDILVNNVGGVSAEAGEELLRQALSLKDEAADVPHMRFSPLAWDHFYQLNLKSHVMLCNAVTPYFIKQRSGKIVNIASDAARLSESENIAYGAMKAADVSLTWSLARALAPFNVNVNCVCPGLVYTPLWEAGGAFYLERARAAVRDAQVKGEKLTPQLERFAKADVAGPLNVREFWLHAIMLPVTPLGREQTPEDIGSAVVFLVSEEARNITGQTLHVDGGMVMR
jgi:NAD(P)-dependent dehydrogenase (short-subunit alcohol dehydrogenase family)